MVEQDILGLQVIVDHLLGQLVQIPDCVHDLPDEQLSLFLLDGAIFAQVVTEVGSVAELQHRAEAGSVDLDRIVQPHNVWMLQLLMHGVLSKCVFYVVVLGLVAPGRTKFVDLAGCLFELLCVKSLF